MNKKYLILALTIIALFLGTLLVMPTASAAIVSSAASPTSGYVGTVVRISGQATPGSEVRFYWDTIDDEHYLGSVTTNPRGVYNFKFEVWPDEPGLHFIIITDGVSVKRIAFFLSTSNLDMRIVERWDRLFQILGEWPAPGHGWPDISTALDDIKFEFEEFYSEWTDFYLNFWLDEWNEFFWDEWFDFYFIQLPWINESIGNWPVDWNGDLISDWSSIAEGLADIKFELYWNFTDLFDLLGDPSAYVWNWTTFADALNDTKYELNYFYYQWLFWNWSQWAPFSWEWGDFYAGFWLIEWPDFYWNFSIFYGNWTEFYWNWTIFYDEWTDFYVEWGTFWGTEWDTFYGEWTTFWGTEWDTFYTQWGNLYSWFGSWPPAARPGWTDLTVALDDIKDEIEALAADVGTWPTTNYADIATFAEDVRTRLVDVAADIGTWPTANYADIATFAEDVRSRLVTLASYVGTWPYDWDGDGAADWNNIAEALDDIKTEFDTFYGEWTTFWGTEWDTFYTQWTTFWGTEWDTFYTQWTTFWGTEWDTFYTQWTTFWGTEWDTFYGEWATFWGTEWDTFYTQWTTFWGTEWDTFYTQWGNLYSWFGSWPVDWNGDGNPDWSDLATALDDIKSELFDWFGSGGTYENTTQIKSKASALTGATNTLTLYVKKSDLSQIGHFTIALGGSITEAGDSITIDVYVDTDGDGVIDTSVTLDTVTGGPLSLDGKGYTYEVVASYVTVTFSDAAPTADTVYVFITVEYPANP